MKRTFWSLIASSVFLAACGQNNPNGYDWGYAPDVVTGDVATADTLEDGSGTDAQRPDEIAVADPAGGDTADDTTAGDDFQVPDIVDDSAVTPDTTAYDDQVSETAGGDAAVGGFDLTGTWAQLHVTSRMSRPFMGSPTPSATTSIQLVRITFESGRFFMETDLCTLTLGQTSALVTTVVPQAFVDSIPTVKREITLAENDGDVRFTEPEHVVLYGVNLANPLTDPLPEDAADPAVWDQDGDGHPGMTIQVKGLVAGDFYLIQRTAASMTGPVERNDRFDGLIASATDQKYLAASPESLMNYVPETYPDTDPSHSYYRHTRIDPSWACDEIIDNQETLFAR